jgi:hypothetical protein
MNVTPYPIVFSYISEDDIPDELKCSICYDPMTKPLHTECDHTFCETCIMDWLQRDATCPFCRTILTKGLHSVVDEEILGKLDALVVKCEDCNTIVPRCEINNHVERCPGPIELLYFSFTFF